MHPIPDEDRCVPTQDADAVIPYRAWRRARSAVLAALAEGPGLVLLVGAPGSGKTTLLRDLARTLQGTGAPVRLLAGCDLRADDLADPIILIDHADAIADSTVLTRRLAGFVVAAGSPSLTGQIGAPEGGLRVVALAGLTEAETGRFATHLLARSKAGPVLLTSSARAQLAVQSRGLPGRLASLVDRSLAVAATERAAYLTGDHVDEAASSAGAARRAVRITGRRPGRPAAVALGMGICGLILLWGSPLLWQAMLPPPARAMMPVPAVLHALPPPPALAAIGAVAAPPVLARAAVPVAPEMIAVVSDDDAAMIQANSVPSSPSADLTVPRKPPAAHRRHGDGHAGALVAAIGQHAVK